MGEKKREALLNCVKDSISFYAFAKSLKAEYSTSFGHFKGPNGKKLISHVSEILQELNHKQYDSLWRSLSDLAFSALQSISDIFSNEEVDGKMETDQNEPVLILQGICILLLSSVTLDEPNITEEMLKAVIMLHGSLFDLHEISASLSMCICVICEDWWKKNLPSHDQLCLSTITFLLRLFVNENKKDKLKDICQMQNCLTFIDFKRKPVGDGGDMVPEEEVLIQGTTEELRQLLLSCFSNYMVLKESHGRKFLSLIMLLNMDIMKDAHQVVISSLTHNCPTTKAKALGNVYFQAWRTAGEDVKESFEEICVQDVMYRAVHAPRTKMNNLFLPLHQMLLSIVCHKGSVEVRHMITRLYNPIIWRSLTAVNAMVRANASNLLLDAFPLEEEDSNKPRVAENEEFMRKQYDAINDMLLDVCPRIRVIGILGLCDLLHMYWDAIPAHVIAILTRKLFNDLAYDAVADVRHAVFQGTIMLLDTACAHPLLSKLLPPCIEKCMHDVSEKVRIAVADVLLAVKQTSSISFWDVCPLPNILAQLEIDNKSVSKRLVKLLLRSFLPEDQSQQVWVERCASFYKRNVNAARKFYMMVDKDLTVQETGEFLNLIGIFTYNCVTRSLQQANTSTSSDLDLSTAESTGNENESQTQSPPIERDVLAGLLDTSCILWRSLNRRMPSSKQTGKNRDLIKRIMITFSRTVHVCLKFANDERCLNAILLLSTYLPPASLPVFSKSVLPKLRSFSDDVSEPHYAMLIECMCAWDWSKQFLELVNEWLSGATEEFTKEDVEEPPQETHEVAEKAVKKKKKKMVMFTGVRQEHRPAQAIKYLKSFIDIQSKSNFSVLDKPPYLETIMAILSNLEKCQNEILKIISTKSSSSSKLWTNDLLVEAVKVRFDILTIIHLHEKQKLKENKEDSEEQSQEPTPAIPLEKLTSVVNWFENVLMKYEKSPKADANTSILATQPASNVLSQMSLYRHLFSTLLQTCLHFLSCDIPLFDKVEDVLLRFTESGINLNEYIEIIIKLIHQLHEHKVLQTDFSCENDDRETADSSRSSVEDSKVHEKLICIYDSFLSSLLQHARQNPDSFLQLFRHDVRQTLRQLVKEQFLIHCHSPKKAWYGVLASKTISAVLANLYDEIRSSSSFSSRNKVVDLPSFSSCILSVMCMTSAECRHICEETILTLARDESTFSTAHPDCIVQTFAHLLYTLSKDGKNKEAANECISELSKIITGFGLILAKLDSNEPPTKEEHLNKTQEEDTCQQQDDNQEEILILEEPDNAPMFMDDEEFVI